MDRKSILFGLLVGLIVVPLFSWGATLITSSQIARKAVTAPKIADSAVQEWKIANKAITAPKIDDYAVKTS